MSKHKFFSFIKSNMDLFEPMFQEEITDKVVTDINDAFQRYANMEFDKDGKRIRYVKRQGRTSESAPVATGVKKHEVRKWLIKLQKEIRENG